MKLLTKITDPGCRLCKLHQGTDYVCESGFFAGAVKKGTTMVVGKMPNSDTYQQSLEEDLAEAGLEPLDLYYTAALKCRSFEMSDGRADLKACKVYLEREIAAIKPKWILAMGNEALSATTGHSGIMKYRGRVIDRLDVSVFPTISPASVRRNPGQRQAYLADLRLFVAQVYAKSAKVPKPDILVVDTKAKVQELRELLQTADLISYDIETAGRDEFDPHGRIVCLAGTIEREEYIPIWDKEETVTKTWVLPLYHPQSPWKTQWKSLLKYLAPDLSGIKKQVAHNGKFDARWLRQFGVPMEVTFDTMLCAHILDENRQKGLKPQAASRLGVAPWAIETRDLYSTQLEQVLEYCALDTWYTYHIYRDMKPELLSQPRLTRVYTKVTMPANKVYIKAEGRGVWMDRERITERGKIAKDMVTEIESQLMQWIPDEIPVLGKGKKQKPAEVNFNPSNFARWWLFEHLGLPILGRGKMKDDGGEGDPSMKEAYMLELKQYHEVPAIMLKRTQWVKICQFLEAYDEILDENDRIHTNFKLAGTVTGRTSSGKADEEKITGRAGDLRGINLQQVPRDPFVRGLFGAAPGYTFIEADFSQVELRIAAFLSRDHTMLRLYQTGQDIHRATASWVLGVPASRVTGDDRKKAKAVNFGFVYGMGAPKFVDTAFEKYELIFTLDQAKDIRRAFFDQFSGLNAWHARQRRLVHTNARVQSPIGRVRHLPDIRSGDRKVQGEAERQAINSPVQSFGSDMMLLSMAMIDDEFQSRQLDAHIIGTVHDAALVEARDDCVGEVMQIMKSNMEDKLIDSLRRKFAVRLDVPVIGDLKVGGWWGDAQEVPGDIVFDDQKLARWLKTTELGRIKVSA